MTKQVSLALAEEISALGRRSPLFLNDWLLRGILDYYVYARRNSFFPHNFLTSGDSPIDVLQEIYRFGTTEIRKRLRTAVERSSSVLVSDDGVEEPLRPIDRLRFAKVISILAPRFHSVDVAPRFVQSALDEGTLWSRQEDVDEIFALAISCLTEIALNAIKSNSWSHQISKRLESELVKLVGSERFKPQYAPKTLHALVKLDPESFFARHRSMLGRHIRMHNSNHPEDARHAHLTSSIIIRECFAQLQRYADGLEVHTGENKDGWIFDSLDHPDSEFQVYRTGGDPASLYFKRTITSAQGQSKSFPERVLTSPSLVYFKPGRGSFSRATKSRDSIRQEIDLDVFTDFAKASSELLAGASS